MKATATVSYGVRNLTEYRALLIGDFTIQDPMLAYFRNDGAVTIRAKNPANTLTFDTLGTVFGVRRDNSLPVRAIN